MTIGNDDFFVPGGLTFGSITGPAIDSVAGPTFDSVISPTPDSIAGFALNFVIGPVSGIITGRVTLLIIESTKSNYFYEKQVMAENLTSSKLFIKVIIWMKNILFGRTREAWNYILSILNDIQRAKMAKDLGHQLIFLAEKMEDGYQQFSDLIKQT